MEEAEQIRAAAKRQFRTLSGYVLYCLHSRLKVEAQLNQEIEVFRQLRRKTRV